MKSKNNLLNLFFVFASKAGGILVGVYFLPLYNEILGTDAFGVIAVILSLQSLLLTLDFGMSTLVGRDTAIDGKANPVKIIREAESVVSVLYCTILPVAFFWWILQEQSLSLLSLFGMFLMFWILTLQNISFAALFAKQEYKAVSSIQIIGVVWRAIFTLFLLNKVEATVDIFIFSQFLTTVINFILLKIICSILLVKKSEIKKESKVKLSSCIQLAKRGRALVFLSIAGAAVLQLDKSIVTIFMSAKELVPYFLASAFCMLPISVLAGPIRQFFQPKIMQAFSQKDQRPFYLQVNLYVKTLVTIVSVVSGIIWILNDWIINLWLRGNEASVDVIALTNIQLPALVLGAFGYIPYIFIVIAEDYKFQAQFSTIMTIVTLFFVTIFAINQNIYLITIMYLVYHLLSTIGLWYRLYSLANMRRIAIQSVEVFCKTVAINILILVMFYLAFNHFGYINN